MTRPAFRPAFYPAFRPAFNKLKSISAAVRSVYNFDGIDDRGILEFKAINMDGDNTLEFWSPPDFTLNGAIISQNISTAGNLREFQFGIDAGGVMYVGFGGTYTTVFTVAQGLKTSTKYGVTLLGTTCSIYEGGLDGPFIRSQTFFKGTAREPAARTLIHSRGNGAGSFGQFSKGIQRDIKINGVLWPIADRNQSIQLPLPTGLGDELWLARNMSGANNAVVTTIVTNAEWDVTRTGAADLADGARSGNFSMPVGVPHIFEVESDGPVNLVVYTSGFTLIAIQRLSNRIVFTPTTTQTLLYVCPANANQTVRIKKPSVKSLLTINTTEVVSNGNFSNGITGWNTIAGGSIGVNSGQVTLTTAAGQPSRFEQQLTLEQGNYYIAEVDLISLNTVTGLRLLISRSTAGNFALIGDVNRATPGKATVIFFATAPDAIIQVRGDGVNAGTLVADNVSLKKINNICNPLTLVNTTPDRWQEVPL